MCPFTRKNGANEARLRAPLNGCRDDGFEGKGTKAEALFRSMDLTQPEGPLFHLHSPRRLRSTIFVNR